MSDKNQEYWKELMGEDFKVDLSPQPAQGRDAAPPEKEASQPSSPDRNGGLDTEKLGFTVEYVSQDGKPVDKPASPHSAPEPHPVQQPTRRPVQQPVQRPQQPAQIPTHQQPAQRPAQQPPVQRPVQSQPPVDRPYSPPVQSAPQQPRQYQPEPEAEYTYSRRKKRDPADKFEVEFDFDAEYADVDEKALKRGRTKRTGCLSGILMFLFVICVSVVLACVGWIWATDVLGLDGEDVPVEVTIPRDIFHTEEREDEDEDGNPITETVDVADMDVVAEELYQKGLIRYKWLFKLFSKLAHGDTKVEAGTFTLNMNYDYRALIHGMSARTGSRKTVDVTIPEGYSITQIVALLEENGVCSSDELIDTLTSYDFDYDFLKGEDVPALGSPKRLEGFMFPDTYQFYVGDDPVNVVKKFLNNFGKKWTGDFDAKAQELGYSMRDILIIASMIEKEAGVDSERDTISSVIYNRLENPDAQGTNGLLQIDATIYYVIADTGEEFSTELDSPYNTYLHPGLPAGPIANPGLASIRAALSPADTDYYYYALGQGNAHRFFKTYKDFTNFVNSEQYGG